MLLTKHGNTSFALFQTSNPVISLSCWALPLVAYQDSSATGSHLFSPWPWGFHGDSSFCVSVPSEALFSEYLTLKPPSWMASNLTGLIVVWCPCGGSPLYFCLWRPVVEDTRSPRWRGYGPWIRMSATASAAAVALRGHTISNQAFWGLFASAPLLSL